MKNEEEKAKEQRQGVFQEQQLRSFTNGAQTQLLKGVVQGSKSFIQQYYNLQTPLNMQSQKLVEDIARRISPLGHHSNFKIEESNPLTILNSHSYLIPQPLTSIEIFQNKFDEQNTPESYFD